VRLICLILTAVCSVAVAGDELEKRLAQADVRVSRRLVSLALRADKAKQQASARRLFERVLVLDPNNGIARGKLGFKKKSGSWERPSAVAVEVFNRKDSDVTRVAKFREERKKLEALRSKDYLKIAEKYGTPKTARTHLLALLAFDPHNPAIHNALGHEKIGDVFVRPELTDFVRAMPQRLAKWKACAEPVEAVKTGRSVMFPGMKFARSILKVGDREVASNLKLSQAIYIARRTESPHALLRVLFGDEAWGYDRPTVYFLNIAGYKDFIHWRLKSASARTAALRYSTYERKELLLVRMKSTLNKALDLYGHTVAFRTVGGLVSPMKADGKRDRNRYSWLKEALGVFVTLELLDSASSWFTSSAESTGKAAPSLPLPTTRSRDVCLAYIREQLYDGTLPPMREVLGSSLNNLDRFRAIYAWTFVRFLALYDPVGFRAFPAALREETEGAQADRTLRALEKSFGKKADELLRLCRAYLLELI